MSGPRNQHHKGQDMADQESTEAEPKEKRPRLPMVRRIENSVLKQAESLLRHAEKAGKFGDAAVDAQFAKTVAELRTLGGLINKLPDDVGKSKRGSAPSAFSLDMLVDVKERFVSNYEGLLEEEDLRELTVWKLAKGKIGVSTKGGVRMFLPKSHLVPTSDSAPAAEEETTEEAAA